MANPSPPLEITVLLPERVLLATSALKVSGDAVNGSFVVLPRHIDFVTALVPGVLSIWPATGTTTYVAIDHGILVKQGASVWVSVLQAIPGDDLDQLLPVVEAEFRQLDDRQTQSRSALAQLEVGFMRGLSNLGRNHRDL